MSLKVACLFEDSDHVLRFPFTRDVINCKMFRVDLTTVMTSLWIKSKIVTSIQMKATDQYFPVMLFITLY